MAEIYIETKRLHAIADAIAALEPCAWTGEITRDQIMIAIGEVGDIWPDLILPDSRQLQETIDLEILPLCNTQRDYQNLN